MTNRFSVVIGVITRVVVGVAVDYRLRLRKYLLRLRKQRLRLGKHDGGNDVKATLLSARELVDGDGILVTLLRCFIGPGFDPGVAPPSHGALRHLHFRRW